MPIAWMGRGFQFMRTLSKVNGLSQIKCVKGAFLEIL